MWDSVKIELDKLKDPSKPDYGATAVELTTSSGAAAEEDFELEEDEDPEWHYDCIDFDDYESEVRRPSHPFCLTNVPAAIPPLPRASH